MSELADYIADHYGMCTLNPCACLKEGWRGRRCPFWVPVNARTWEELHKVQRIYASAGAP